ncbi:hypothetical protein F4677DRAFT_440213 [Hypoxylon crocopeplum]|nr:hypothetical protein F4677DRAFT_440213 [Hypoxylon crocopeplum]
MFEKLFEACRRIDEAQTPPSEPPEDLLQLIPDGVTTKDVNQFLLTSIKELNSITALWAAYAGVLKISKNVKGEQDGSGHDADTLTEIADRISSMTLPLCTGASLDNDTTDYAALRRKGELGLRVLDQLTEIPQNEPLQLRPSTLLRVTAFSDIADPWTTAASSELAGSILSPLDEQPQKQTQLIADEILIGFLRPLFSKSRPAAVTASGRKAEYVEQSRYDAVARDSPETKPWKYVHRYAVTVFAWAVRRADAPLLQKHWHLFTPVLLTLLDEQHSTPLKIRALCILRAFWSRCPAGLMRDTGLADVFEQAVFPSVLFLPSLTPEDESLQILGAAYPVLIEMAGLDCATLTDTDATTSASVAEKQPQDITEGQRKLLDKIIREGVMVGYHHAKEHVRLDFIPMVSDILTDPFGTKHPPTLYSAAKLLQAVLRNCWPRIPHYGNEVVKMLMLCWLNIEDEESFPSTGPSADDLKAELTKTADMLAAVMKAAKEDLSERVNPLIEKEPHLSQLFRTNNSS